MYRLTSSASVVLRVADNANIPNDLNNLDWNAYQEWLDAGNTPEPYVAPVKE